MSFFILKISFQKWVAGSLSALLILSSASFSQASVRADFTHPHNHLFLDKALVAYYTAGFASHHLSDIRARVEAAHHLFQNTQRLELGPELAKMKKHKKH